MGFVLGFDSQVITGHIDFLQIRNGHIPILDYEPEARKERTRLQLTIYALALSCRTGLPLKYFKVRLARRARLLRVLPAPGRLA